jgi:hypothetical protein
VLRERDDACDRDDGNRIRMRDARKNDEDDPNDAEDRRHEIDARNEEAALAQLP